MVDKSWTPITLVAFAAPACANDSGTRGSLCDAMGSRTMSEAADAEAPECPAEDGEAVAEAAPGDRYLADRADGTFL